MPTPDMNIIPTPWNVDKRGVGGMVYVTAKKPTNFKGAFYYVATVESNEDGVNNELRRQEAEAYAHLIAAAPDLYFAVCDLLDSVNVRIDDPRIAIFDRLRAAKAKAENALPVEPSNTVEK